MAGEQEGRDFLSEFGGSRRGEVGAKKTDQQSARSFHLELRPLNGRPEFVAWQLYQRAKHFDDEDPERFVIIFHTCVVTIYGYALQEIPRFINLERNELIAEQLPQAREEIMTENEKQGYDSRKAVIQKVVVLPDFNEAVAAALNLIQDQPPNE